MKKVRTGLTLAVLLLSSMIGTMAFASVSDDQVTSQKIKEADGTSGQNTNSGSGVKTGHIQNGAVTTSKIAVSAVTSSVIANGAVTSATIADGAVTDAKITGPISGAKLGTHTHGGGDIIDGTITNAKIQDGAVTDAKIAGPIAGSKISTTGLNADTVDGQHASAFAPAAHMHSMASVSGLEVSLAGKSDVTHSHDTLYQQKYGKVAVVALTGGDYTDPVTAMNAVADWCGTPSATNPCLLKVMPGIYDIGANSLGGNIWGPNQVFIDIEGSGEAVTRIKGTADIGVIRNWSNSEIRLITIENYGSGVNVSKAAISTVYGSADERLSLSHVTLISSGGSDVNSGVTAGGVGGLVTISDSTINVSGGEHANGINVVGTGPGHIVLNNVSINASNARAAVGICGLCADSSVPGSFALNNVNIVAAGMEYSYAVYGNSATIKGSTIKAIPGQRPSYSVLGYAKIADTELDGQISSGLSCIGVYDSSFNPITCP